MDDSHLAPWKAWTACSLRLQDIEVPAPQLDRVARTLARLAPLLDGLADKAAVPAAPRPTGSP